MGGQEMYSTWTYTKIVPLRELEYLHHFSEEDGNRVEPVSQGLPPELPERGAKSRHLQSRGRRQDGSKRHGIRLAGGPHDGDVQNGHGTVPRQDGRDLCQALIPKASGFASLLSPR
jgi:hypothetical protein